MNNKPTCVISAPVFNRSGYGSMATAIAKSLIRQNKYDVQIIPQKWGGCPAETIDEGDLENIAVVNRILRQPLTKQPDLFFQISIPNEFQRIGKYNVGLTAGIETSAPSGEFVEGINRFDLTILTSNFSKKVFEDVKYTKTFTDGTNRTEQLKVEKPMEVCFWGSDTNIFKKTDEKIQSVEDIMEEIPETFAFLFSGQWTHGGTYNDRKDIGNLIKTFCIAFKDKETQPCLLLKTSGVNYSIHDKYDMLKKIAEVKSSISGKLPNIYLIHGELSQKELNALLNHPKVKAFVHFTHGEGFGANILEATLSGKPVLVSNWSGHLDFLNPKYAHLLEGTIGPIHPDSVNKWLIKESNWFTVSYSLAEEKLRNIYNHYGPKLLEKAELLRLENSENFNLPAMDKRLWSILDKYVPEFAVENRLVLPSMKKISLPKLMDK